MTSEVSEDAERASPANTQAHKTTNVYHPTWKWNGTYFGVLLAPWRRRKNLLSTKNCQLFFVFFSWSRVAHWKKKANGPVECAQPAGCAQKGAAYWFLHVSIGNNVRKKGRKGELQMGENVWDAAMRYRRLFSQQCSGSFLPPLPRRVPANPPSCVLGVDGGLCGRTEDGVGPAGERTERRRQRGRSEGITEREGRRWRPSTWESIWLIHTHTHIRVLFPLGISFTPKSLYPKQPC